MAGIKGESRMEIVHKFANSAMAWGFVNRCDDAGAMAGFPAVDGSHTVRTLDVITSEQVRAVRADARGNQRLIDACNVALWEADRHGIITSRTESVDRVRAVIVARMDAGEL
jgi:hypothetical protein